MEDIITSASSIKPAISVPLVKPSPSLEGGKPSSALYPKLPKSTDFSGLIPDALVHSGSKLKATPAKADDDHHRPRSEFDIEGLKRIMGSDAAISRSKRSTTCIDLPKELATCINNKLVAYKERIAPIYNYSEILNSLMHVNKPIELVRQSYITNIDFPIVSTAFISNAVEPYVEILKLDEYFIVKFNRSIILKLDIEYSFTIWSSIELIYSREKGVYTNENSLSYDITIQPNAIVLKEVWLDGTQRIMIFTKMAVVVIFKFLTTIECVFLGGFMNDLLTSNSYTVNRLQLLTKESDKVTSLVDSTMFVTHTINGNEGNIFSVNSSELYYIGILDTSTSVEFVNDLTVRFIHPTHGVYDCGLV